MSFLRTTLVALSLLLAAPAAEARPFLGKGLSRISGKGQSAASGRRQVLRQGLRVHRMLVEARTPLALPPGGVLSDGAAASKTYGQSWTCRESSRLLIAKLGESGCALRLASSGQNAFDWGAEGKVSYHYYAVDDPQRPTLLLDPTASSNFALDAQPQGLLHGFLHSAAKQLGQNDKTAQKIARRVAKGSGRGLLVLTRSDEIVVYRAALELAAERRAQVTRNAERR